MSGTQLGGQVFITLDFSHGEHAVWGVRCSRGTSVDTKRDFGLGSRLGSSSKPIITCSDVMWWFSRTQYHVLITRRKLTYIYMGETLVRKDAGVTCLWTCWALARRENARTSYWLRGSDLWTCRPATDAPTPLTLLDSLLAQLDAIWPSREPWRVAERRDSWRVFAVCWKWPFWRRCSLMYRSPRYGIISSTWLVNLVWTPAVDL